MPEGADRVPERSAIRTRTRVFRGAARPLVRRAARQILEGRLLDAEMPDQGRWLRADVDELLAATWRRVDELLPAARLRELPTLGNRLNVFMAVVTTAAYQALLDRGVSREYAATLIADVGWKIYAWMLGAAAWPARVVFRSPRRRLEATLRLLMRFPFSAPGKPGYEVETWSEGDRFHTHWKHCPPQAFVRELVENAGDRGELDAFFRSWCLYDWAGADLLVGDGRRGHYERPHTMSRGDPVCDMCWHARPPGDAAAGSRPQAAEVERTRRLYRRVVHLYDPFRSLWSRWTRPAEDALDGLFRERIGSKTRILELAPGTGINVERLHRCAPDFASYLGIDSSEKMLSRAREKARGDSRIELRIGDATDLRSVEGCFEFVVCTWLLSHLDAPAETVRDALSKLSPGGTAVFVFFTRPKGAFLRRVLGRLGGPLRYRFVDAEAIRTLPNLERLESCADGMATLAVFRAPATAEST